MLIKIAKKSLSITDEFIAEIFLYLSNFDSFQSTVFKTTLITVISEEVVKTAMYLRIVYQKVMWHHFQSYFDETMLLSPRSEQ